MRPLDPYTVLFMTAFSCIGMSAIMFSVHRSFRKEVQGVGHWAWAQLAMVLAGLLLTLRGTLPDVFILPASNAALLWSVGLSLIGTQLFYGRQASWRFFHLVWSTTVLGLIWWLVAAPNFALRVALYSAAELTLHLAQLSLVARYGERHFTSYFFGALLLAQCALALARGAAALLAGANTVDLANGTILANSYIAVSNFVILLLTVAFLVLAARRLQQALEHRSAHDALTGVLNRRGFDEFYARSQQRMRQGDTPLSLLAIDLDHFKAVNDYHGHATGDRVLVHVAQLIRQALREADQVARFGGEEFVALLPGTSTAEARQVAVRIQALLQHASNDTLSCTVSIGVATEAYTQNAQEDLDSLLARADEALYRAKAAGRNRIELAAAVPTRRFG